MPVIQSPPMPSHAATEDEDDEEDEESAGGLYLCYLIGWVWQYYESGACLTLYNCRKY